MDHARSSDNAQALLLRGAVHDHGGRWGLTDDERREIIAAMMRVVRESRSDRSMVMAARVLVAADAVDAKREATTLEDQRGQQHVAVAALRTALGSPQARAALAGLSASLVVAKDEGEPHQPEEQNADGVQ